MVRTFKIVALASCFSCPLSAVKFFKDVVPAVGGSMTVALNTGSIVRGIKKTPKVVAATAKGPKAMIEAAKTKPVKGSALKKGKAK